MARAETETLLSLDRFAKIMGINPAHFNQGYADAVFPVKSNRCEDVWPQESWHYSDHVGREDLAREISKAESDIADVVGFWPAPKWIAQEVHQFPRHHRPDVIRAGGLNVRGFHVSVDLNYGKFIEAGQRATTLIGTATKAVTLVYSLTPTTMTATITLPTTETNVCQIRAYFADEDGEINWQIRDPISVTIVGANVVLVYESWKFIKPELWYEYPTTEDFAAIDVANADNLVDTVEVYREYNDTTATSAVFYWEPTPRLGVNFCSSCGGTGCVTCALTTQNGCLFPRDVETGTVVPVVAAYDADSSGWLESCWTECRDPDQIKAYYYAGLTSNRWRRGSSCEPLDESWARVIARMATARLERPFCHCSHVTALSVDLRRDLSLSNDSGSFSVPFEILGNPFGRRKGEVEAWNFVTRIVKRRMTGGTF
jgi:hypothetical protein